MDGPEAHCRCFRTICLLILCSFTAIKSETNVSFTPSGPMPTEPATTTMTAIPSPTTTESSSTSDTPGTSTTSSENTTPSTTTTTIISTSPKTEYGQNCTDDEQCYGRTYNCSITSNVCVCSNDSFKYKTKCRRLFRLMPENLRVTDHGSDTITVFWNLSLSCKGCEYHIEYFSTPDDHKNATTNQQTFKLTGLQSNQIYNISVQTVYNESGQTPVISEKVSINSTTLKSKAENFTFADITANSVMVSFDEPRYDNSDIFRLEVKNTISDETVCVLLDRNSSGDVCGTYRSKNKTCNVSMLPDNVKHISYNVTGLTPSTNYNITVVMVTCNHGNSRESNPEEISITTREPVRVENLTATSNGSQVCATWEPPSNYTRLLGYYVELMDHVNKAITKKRSLPENRTMICFEELHLFGFWEYRFHVTANTSSGAGPKSLSNIVITKAKEPVIDFTKVNTRYVGECYRRIRISWNDPKPEKRGTRIKRYEIYANNLQRVYYRNVSTKLSNANDTMYRRTPSQSYSILIPVTPGSTYSFKAIIYDDKDKEFSGGEKKIAVPTGKPRDWNKRNRPTRISFTETTLTLRFYDTTFLDRGNHEISDSGLIVIRSPATVIDARTIKASWFDGGGLYRIPLSSVNRTVGRLILGADGDCSGIQQRNFCNGKLSAGTGYSVMVFLCTGCGCIQSPPLGPYYTKEVDNSVTVTVALVCVALLVGVTVVVAACLWRISKSKKKEDDYVLTVTPMYQDAPTRRSVEMENVIYQNADGDHAYAEIDAGDHVYAEID